MALGVEQRESGKVYTCPPGSTMTSPSPSPCWFGRLGTCTSTPGPVRSSTPTGRSANDRHTVRRLGPDALRLRASRRSGRGPGRRAFTKAPHVVARPRWFGATIDAGSCQSADRHGTRLPTQRREHEFSHDGWPVAARSDANRTSVLIEPMNAEATPKACWQLSGARVSHLYENAAKFVCKSPTVDCALCLLNLQSHTLPNIWM